MKCKMYLRVLLSVLLSISTADYVSTIVVETTEGQVQGFLADDGYYYAFYGIRYGADTDGANRFKAPRTPPSYEGVFKAIDRDVLCPQPSLENQENIIGTEDCLRVSIFTPNVTTASANPVLVWLIGEEYTTSNPIQYSFRRLVQEKFTVVALNYRLSVLGFLCLGIEEAPGNAGLKDVVQGLKWIKNNIEGFGGDPNNVVLFGHGSGAAMVDFVTMSPLAEGLVHKALAQSGSALAPWAITYSPVAPAFSLGAQLGYQGNDRQKLVQTLISATPRELIYPIVHETQYTPNLVPFAPCIENDRLNATNRFLTDAPMNLLLLGNYNKIPYIGGYVNREGSVRVGEAVNGNWLQRMENEFEQFFPVDLTFRDDLKSSVREFYFGNETIDMNKIENYTDFHGDTLTVMSVIRGAVARANTSGSSEVRLLEFIYRGANDSDWQFPDITPTGVRHGEILKYLWDINLDSYDAKISDSLAGRYINFAKTGIPSSIHNFTSWEPLQPNTRSFPALRIDGGKIPQQNPNLTVWSHSEVDIFNPQMSKRIFWDPIYEHHYKYPPMVDSSGETCTFTSMILLLQLLYWHL